MKVLLIAVLVVIALYSIEHIASLNEEEAPPQMRDVSQVGVAMHPTILDGQTIRVVQVSKIERLQIVVYRAPGEDKWFVGRVVGLPTERVEVSAGRVRINGTALVEDYIAEGPAYEMQGLVIPAGHYFLMGDNRNNSYDSHVFGPVDGLMIAGVVTEIER